MAYKITAARVPFAIGGMLLLPADGGRHTHKLLMAGDSLTVDELPFGVESNPRFIVEDLDAPEAEPVAKTRKRK